MAAAQYARFNGVRGSAPASSAAFADFGGDTPSLEIASLDARLFIDAGSGLKNVAASADIPEEIDLILSHYHYDHLIGLPFFEPAWRSAGKLRIWAPKFDQRPPRDILETLFSPPFCPVSLDMFRTRVDVRPYAPGDGWALGGDMFISTMRLDHPGGAAAIRVSGPGGDLVYASDCETSDPAAAERLAAFSERADLLVIDAMNNDQNARERIGWGHSSWREALAVGSAANAARIALFHHDPRSDDQSLGAIEEAARSQDARAFLARQGMTLDLNPGAAIAGAPPHICRGERTPWRCSR